jgi:hypothetical protein
MITSEGRIQPAQPLIYLAISTEFKTGFGKHIWRPLSILNPAFMVQSKKKTIMSVATVTGLSCEQSGFVMTCPDLILCWQTLQMSQ